MQNTNKFKLQEIFIHRRQYQHFFVYEFIYISQTYLSIQNVVTKEKG